MPSAGSGGAAGVLLGGMLTEWAGWEWVLFVNVPIGIGAALVAPRLVAESRDDSSPSFDIAGAVSVTAGLALLVYTLVDANNAGWGSDADDHARGALGGVAHGLRPDRAAAALPARPVLDLQAAHAARGSNVIGLLLGMSLFAMFFFISLYMQQVMGYDAAQGRARVPAARRADHHLRQRRVSARRTLRLQAGADHGDDADRRGGLYWFSHVSAPGGTYVGDVLFPSMLAAVGLGLAFVPVTIAAVTGTKPAEAGLASGLINTSQQVGGALGLGGAGRDLDGTHERRARRRRTRAKAVALTEGFQAAFLAGAVIALVGALLRRS